MFSLDSLRDLYRHMEWADATVWEAAAPLAAATIDERLRRLLLHTHVVQRAFLNVWTGRPMEFPEPETFQTLAEVRAWGEPYYLEVVQFFDVLDPQRLVEPVTMPWLAEFEQQTGKRFAQPTLGETIFQVTSHSTYHRAQVNTRLRELGVEPPLVDYIAWVWFGRPAHNKTGLSPV
jgi:uncharacterized damage-inducible protein DinB